MGFDGTRVIGKAAFRKFLADMFERIPDGVRGCDILALKAGQITAKRSYRKGRL